jgi:hypothetical protein
MIRNPRRVRRLLVLVPALATVLGTVQPSMGAARAEESSAAATEVGWSTSSVHPFSAPTWLPLREPAAISCTYKNCPGPFHGYWALDLLGERGDPIFAAGAGVFHVGAVDSSCKTAAAPDAPGTWAWIDHGGGVVSRYHHLDVVTAREGQLVTPVTQIGRMGHSGDFAPCTTNYLHFEVRRGGVKGTRVDPGQLRGCEGVIRRSYPLALGYSSWNSLPKARVWTPALTAECMPSTTATATAPAPFVVTRANAAARLYWRTPTTAGTTVDRYVVRQEMWAPSVGRYHAPTYRSVSHDQRSLTVSGLQNGRKYRFTVLAHNSVGNSAWAAGRVVVPATVPTVPDTDRGLRPSTTSAWFGWWKSKERGTSVTSYTVAIRKRTADGWTRWAYRKVDSGTYSYRFTSLRPGRTYQVTVRADSSAGSSRYGKNRTVTTTR